MNRKKREQLEYACEAYLPELKLKEELEEQYPDLCIPAPDPSLFTIDLDENHGRGNLELYRLICENIRFTEEELRRADELPAGHAGVILACLLIERHTQQETAEIFGMTRRQLQSLLEKIYGGLGYDE